MVAGYVFTREGNAVAEAEVELDGSLKTRTDATGWFTFTEVAAGTHRVIVRKFGLAPRSAETRTLGTRPVILYFVMEGAVAGAQQLEAVRVEARALTPPEYRTRRIYDDFFRRRSSAVSGTFWTRAQLDSVGGVARVFQSTAGVRVDYGRLGRIVRLQLGSCGDLGTGLPAVIVDGILQRGLGRLAELNDGEIELLEVYRDPSGVPPEARGAGCGAVVVYTR